MRMYIMCVLFSLIYIALFYLWGKAFLSICLRIDAGACGSVLFGYLIIQILYQVVYLPTMLLRGSYRTVTWIWLVAILGLSVYLCFRVKYKKPSFRQIQMGKLVALVGAAIVILFLACFIALHPLAYGVDTNYYISSMNLMIYNDNLWTKGGLNFHNGMNSLFSLLALPSLIAGIPPYYVSVFLMRILLVFLTSMTAYYTAKVVFDRENHGISWAGLFAAVLLPIFLVFWNSPYQATFFIRRSNEAKAYGQFILLPIGFAVFLEMLRGDAERRTGWYKQLAVGLAAIAVSASSMTAYLFLLAMGTAAILAHDCFKGAGKTLGFAGLCALPNLLYLIAYVLQIKGLLLI